VEAGGLLVLLGIALAIRLANLGELPNGLFCDEASNGLDAWCIAHTGRSLHGDFLPMIFLQHGRNHIEALYAYLSVPIVALGGLSVFTTRFVAALGGTLLVATSWLAGRALLGRRAGWLTALLAVVSPWTFTFSRMGFRGVLAPMLLMLGLWGAVRMFERKGFVFVAALGFGLSLHSYSVTKAFVPLALAALFVLFLPELKGFLSDRRNWRLSALAAALFLVLVVPIYAHSFFGPGNARFQSMSVGQTERPVAAFAGNVMAHLSPRFLFLEGDANGRHTAPGTGGVLLFVTMPLLLSGVIAMVWRRDRRLLAVLILLILGIVPSALTTNGIPHALRSIEAAPFAHMLSAGGAVFLADTLAKLWSAKVGVIILAIVVVSICANGAWFLQKYFRTYPARSQPWFQYGMAEAVKMAEMVPHERVVLSGTIHNGYIFPLFFSAVESERYQTENSQIALDARYFWLAGRTLRQLPEGPRGERWLLIGKPGELPGAQMMIRGAGDIPFLEISEREF
jgi:4-amino-4-deoxy-L-arabinose transferase-like glycosyltransferase